MPKQTPKGKSQPGIVTRIRTFIDEVRAEMSKVTWPSRDELKSSTQVVLMLLFLMAAIIYLYDVAFQFVVVRLLEFG